MAYFFQLFLAFIIASLISMLELITSKYPRTFFLLKKSWALYTYALIYGVISFVVMLVLNSLIIAGIVKLEGVGISNLWTQSIAVGLATKAFLHIRFFNVSSGSQSFPVGTETIVQLFEPWLLRTIELDNFNAVRNFINSRANKYNDLNDVKTKSRNNLPRTFSEQDRTAFQADIDKEQALIVSSHHS